MLGEAGGEKETVRSSDSTGIGLGGLELEVSVVVVEEESSGVCIAEGGKSIGATRRIVLSSEGKIS